MRDEARDEVLTGVEAGTLAPDEAARLVAEAPAPVAALVAADPAVAPDVAALAARDRRPAVRRAGLARVAEVDLLAEAVTGARPEADALAALGNPACPVELLVEEAVAGPPTRARSALAHPACPPDAAGEGARRLGPAALFGRGSAASRLAWATAVLEAHPGLAAAFARADDPHTRRAVLRLPGLPLEVAAEVVATRRSGLHTLARNPFLPLDLAGETASKRRRRAPIDELVGDAPERLGDAPALHPPAIALGSGTLDLLLVRSPHLDRAGAEALAGRRQPPADGWVLAALVERFGVAAWRAAGPATSTERRAAAAEHSPLAAALGALRAPGR